MKKKIKCILIGIIVINIFLVCNIQKEKDLKQIKNNKNIELAIYINEEETNTIPSKESGYYYDREKSSCTNGAYINWDSISWSPVVSNMNEYKTRCELHFTTTYTEGILNGTDPVLEEPLIPVTIESDGTVKKANLESEWYNYENKEWANAVILFNENETYEDGEIIPEEKIESYFVWIPKYRYQLWDLGLYDSITTIDTSKVHEIPIIFGDYNTSDDKEGECTTPMESGATGNCNIGDYMTHPAFLSISSTGFWVGKFDTSTTLTSNYNVVNSSAIQIKANVSSWGGIQVANAFYTSYNYQRNLDSHMMKNTEWGAVAYLQHSAYGSSTSVRINNNSSAITGYASKSEPTCGATNSNLACNRYCSDGTCNTAYPNSVLASTTGNISGIYDMSGGLDEYVMGVEKNENGEIMVGSSQYTSGFNGHLNNGTLVTNGCDLPDKKYYDLYEYTSSGYYVRILGDAMGETGPFQNIEYTSGYATRQINSWYGDSGTDFNRNSERPWIVRGGTFMHGSECGMFSFGPHYGNAVSSYGFRVVLTP